MKIRIKKFKLRYAGHTFGAGAEIDIPEAEAKKLVAANPEQFEYVPDTPEEAAEKAKIIVTDKETGEESFNLDGMTVAQLKEFAKEKNIDISEATKKQDIIDAIVAAAEPQEPEGLPQVDLKGTVK